MKLKNINLVFLLIIILFSCSSDDLKTTSETLESKMSFTQNNFTVKKMSTDEINNKAIKNTLLKFGKSKTTNLRSLYNADYGFAINTEHSNYVLNNTTGQESYSYLIYRDNPTTPNLENLMFLSQPDGTYISLLVTYGFTADDVLSNNPMALEANPTVYTQINLDPDTVLNERIWYSTSCVPSGYTYIGTQHEGQNHGIVGGGVPNAGECEEPSCDYGKEVYVSTGTLCTTTFWDDGNNTGTGGTYNPGSGTGHPNGTTTSTNGTISGAPMIDEDCIEPTQEFISSLENIIGTNYSIQSCSNLKDKLVLESLSELQNFLNTITDNLTLEPTLVVENFDGTKTSKFIMKMNHPSLFLISVNINTHITSVLDDPNTASFEFEITDVNSFESGFTPFINWEKDSYSFSISGNVTTVVLEGHFDFGVSIEGFDINFDEFGTITMTFNNQTGEELSQTMTLN